MRRINTGRWVVPMLIVALAIGCIALSGRFVPASSTENSASSSVSAAEMLQAAITGEGISLGRTDQLPDGFEQELFSAEGFSEVRVDDAGQIVGLMGTGTAEDVFDECRSQMERNGWTYVDSGQATRATFLKSSGSYRWSCLDCTQVGSQVAIVAVISQGE
ncbi:MAG: hypothetical protein ACOX1O_03395 [Eggerthellaceae bacterium]|jgi:hypothetical protein